MRPRLFRLYHLGHAVYNDSKGNLLLLKQDDALLPPACACSSEIKPIGLDLLMPGRRLIEHGVDGAKEPFRQREYQIAA